MGFSRQEHWRGLLFHSPGDFPNPGIEPRFPPLQADTLPSEPPAKSFYLTSQQYGAGMILLFLKCLLLATYSYYSSGLSVQLAVVHLHSFLSGLWRTPKQCLDSWGLILFYGFKSYRLNNYLPDGSSLDRSPKSQTSVSPAEATPRCDYIIDISHSPRLGPLAVFPILVNYSSFLPVAQANNERL